MHRFFAESVDGNIAFLSKEDAAHAYRVLRLSPGQNVEICFMGMKCSSEIISLSADSAVLKTGEFTPVGSEPRVNVTLYQGMPKSGKLETIIQKCVELGVFEVVPVEFNRSVAKIKENSKKHDRYNTVAREAARQSGRAIIPRVLSPVPFGEILTAIKAHELTIVCWEESDASLYDALSYAGSVKSVGLVIGPEGGIERHEIEALESAEVRTVSLGKRILRTETAGLAALSAIMFHFGEFSV